MNLTSKPFFDLTEYFMHIYNEFNHLITTEQVDYKRAFFHFEQIILNIQLDEITPFEGEVFEKKFTFEPLNSFYTLYWSVSKLQEIIKENQIKSQPFNMDMLVISYDKKTKYLDQQYHTPIIVGGFPHIEELIVLDGNKRCHHALQHNLRGIDAYYLRPELHKKCMVFNYCPLIFDIHNNINLMYKYFIHDISKEEFVSNWIHF